MHLGARTIRHFDEPEPGLGFVEMADGAGTEVHTGAVLRQIAADRYDDRAVLDEARRVLRTALAAALEGRELRTRAVARAVSRSNGGRKT